MGAGHLARLRRLEPAKVEAGPPGRLGKREPPRNQVSGECFRGRPDGGGAVVVGTRVLRRSVRLSNMLFLPTVVNGNSPPAVYDFYFPSVKKGSCTVRREGDSLVLDSRPGFSVDSRVTITFQGSRPLQATIQSKSGMVEYAFVGPHSTPEGAVSALALYSPTQPALLPYVLNQYDGRKGGFQKLHATDVATQKPRELTVELFRAASRTVAGRRLTLREWRLESPPTAEAVIWTDQSNTPLYWWVPAQSFEIVRRGYEALRPASKYEKSVSPARFTSTVDKNVWMPMRDGLRLMADVYRPSTPGHYPVILQRTCYDRSEFGNADGEFCAQRGYVYVTQHVRGRGGSEGAFEPEWNEAADGYDTVAWCGTQTWSNGRVGMLGASYNGYCEWMAAQTRPKWLKTMISVVPMPGSPDGEPWTGGAFYFGSELAWYGLLRDRAKVQPFNDDVTAATNTLPIGKADSVLFGHELPQYQERIKSDRYDAAVARASYQEGLKRINLPVLYLDGWLDTVAVGTRINYTTMVRNGRTNQKLVWGPWNHFTNRESRDGVTDFTPDGYIDMRTLTLRWFDRWLKGLPNGIDKEPAVAQFVLGDNKWYQSRSWPPENMLPERWYLNGEGSLAPTKPKGTPKSTYVYDPAKYVYSNDSPAGFFFLKGDNAASLCKGGGHVMYESKILKKPITLDGPIRAKLFASTDAVDTDWVMTLLDVHPDGVAVPIQTGFVRARYRKSLTKPMRLKPGEIFGYDLDLWQTGITIPPGHRLRVVVASTLFPDMDRNLNTGEPAATAVRILVAHQSVYHESGRASYIELPVLRRHGIT